MNLSDLPPKRQEEIVRERIDNMKDLERQALRNMDPILLATLELDAQARLMGINMNYCEQCDESEDEIE